MTFQSVLSMYSSLTCHEIVHFLLSIIVGLVVWRMVQHKKNPYRFILPSFIGAFLGEFFLDIDHLLDYFIAFGIRFRLDYFLSGMQFAKLHKTFVPLHSWELVVIIVFIAIVIKNKSVRYFFIALAIGLFTHLVYDTVYNHFYILGYSFIYRYLHNFDLRFIAK